MKGKLPSSVLNQDPASWTPDKRGGGGEDNDSGDDERPGTPDQEELNKSDDEDDTVRTLILLVGVLSATEPNTNHALIRFLRLFQPDVEMNWNLMKFLPEAGACQTNFNVSGAFRF